MGYFHLDGFLSCLAYLFKTKHLLLRMRLCSKPEVPLAFLNYLCQPFCYVTNKMASLYHQDKDRQVNVKNDDHHGEKESSAPREWWAPHEFVNLNTGLPRGTILLKQP